MTIPPAPSIAQATRDLLTTGRSTLALVGRTSTVAQIMPATISLYLPSTEYATSAATPCASLVGRDHCPSGRTSAARRTDMVRDVFLASTTHRVRDPQ
jgi:hypothetical protein